MSGTQQEAVTRRTTMKTEETIALAFKADVASAIQKAMKKQKVNQSELARRMGTSRAVVYRLLQRDDPGVTLGTISKALSALGRTIRIRTPAVAA